MTISINSFSELQKQIPLIQFCIAKPSLAACQKVYNKYALQIVVDICNLKDASDYSWDPEAAVKEFQLKQIILNFLRVESSLPLTANHVFCYLKLNELER